MTEIAQGVYNLRFVEPEAAVRFALARSRGKAKVNADSRLALATAADWLASFTRGEKKHCLLCAVDIASLQPKSVPWEIVVLTPFVPTAGSVAWCGGLCRDCFEKPPAQKQAEAFKALGVMTGGKPQPLPAGKA